MKPYDPESLRAAVGEAVAEATRVAETFEPRVYRGTIVTHADPSAAAAVMAHCNADAAKAVDVIAETMVGGFGPAPEVISASEQELQRMCDAVRTSLLGCTDEQVPADSTLLARFRPALTAFLVAGLAGLGATWAGSAPGPAGWGVLALTACLWALHARTAPEALRRVLRRVSNARVRRAYRRHLRRLEQRLRLRELMRIDECERRARASEWAAPQTERIGRKLSYARELGLQAVPVKALNQQ